MWFCTQGAFPSPCGPASSSSLLDEAILMEFLAEEDQVVETNEDSL